MPHGSSRAVRAALSFFAPHRGPLATAALLAVGAALLSALEPLLYKAIFDAFGGAELSRAGSLVGALVLVLLAREGACALLDVLVWRVRLDVNHDMLAETVERLHALPLAHHRDQRVGATMTKMERGIQGALVAFSDVVFHLVPSLVYLVLSAVFMLRLEWRLSLVVIVFAPIPAVIGAWASKEQTRRERRLLKRWARIFARLHEVLSGIAVVKSFVREDDERRRFLSGVRSANLIVARGVGVDARVNASKNGVMALARVTAIALGGLLVARREISLGTLVAFLGYVGGVFQPVQTLTGMYQVVRKGVVSLEALLSILTATEAVRDRPGAREGEPVRGAVRFERVSFSYRPGAPVLREIDLDVRPGEMIALVGASGAGKSTLMALLERLYDPTEGRVLVDGVDVRALKQKWLRGQIGVVLQEGMLFSDSVRDNIAFGRPSAMDAEIEAAASAANAHEFISRLPRGYDTPVGERGCRLSGGERQRVAIARALLKDAPILVLDEATSALDAESEDLVRAALARLTKGRTTFVIAHRLSTVTEADRIVVFDRGRIVEVGRHDELIAREGVYARLVSRQARGLTVAAASGRQVA